MPVLQLVFENVQATYAPGQTVVGLARMHFDKRTKARCMKLNINGKGFFHHTEGKTHYITREPYMDMDVIFTQPLGTNQEEFYIEPGDYAYPFSFLLPKNLPSSFTYANGKVCTIKYIIKLVVVKPWSFDDKCEREITIREQFDISDNLLLGLPFAYDGLINAYTFFCCNKRTLSASIILKRRFFGQQDTITINGVIKNDSLKPVEQLYLVLVETVAFRCKERIWVDTNYLTGFPLKPMPPQHSERLENLELKVPILKNPVLNNSNMVAIKHALLITSKNDPKFADTDNLVMPIIIGSTIVSPDQASNPQN